MTQDTEVMPLEDAPDPYCLLEAGQLSEREIIMLFQEHISDYTIWLHPNPAFLVTAETLINRGLCRVTVH